MHMGTTNPFLNQKSYLMYPTFYPQTCKNSSSNTLYSGLHKNDKHVDLSMYIFKSTNFIRFYFFIP
jgi:hypothetical protein